MLGGSLAHDMIGAQNRCNKTQQGMLRLAAFFSSFAFAESFKHLIPNRYSM
jgi:hypothetical protein